MWEDRYKASEDYLFGQQPAGFLLENPGWLHAGQRALCVADGEGRNSVHLAERGLEVTAFDMAPTAVERGRALAAERGVAVDFHVSDWQGWDWTRGFDLVVAIFIQFADPRRARASSPTCGARSRRGGCLMLHGYTPEQVDYGTGGPPHRENMYTRDAAPRLWRLADRTAGRL